MYDGADRVTQTKQNGKIIHYGYDIPGRTRTLTYPGGRTITERMDIRSRLSRIDDADPNLVQYSYDAGDRVLSRVYRNGVTASYTYNANDWVTSLEHSVGITRIAGFSHDYDNEGNKRFEEKRTDSVASQTKSEAYQYDNIYRLIDYKVGTLSGSTVPLPTTQTQYALDPVGNWNVKTKNAIPETRTHNAVNEITAINAAPLAYDNNGNLNINGGPISPYDEENRLVQASSSLVEVVYQYDALGRRVSKIFPGFEGGGTVSNYYYDSARIVEEQNSAGTTQATYVYGNYVDEVLNMARSGVSFYYHQNALWSVEAITDSAANVVERYSYDAYGLPVMTNGAGVSLPRSAIGNPWMFTGRQLDEETGLYYYRARHLDPVKGRFLQRDPVGIWGDPNNLGNGYAYVGNRPTDDADPTGEQCCRGCTCTGNTGSGGGGRRTSAAADPTGERCCRGCTCTSNTGSGGGGRRTSAGGSTSGSPTPGSWGGSYYGPRRDYASNGPSVPASAPCCADGWNGWGRPAEGPLPHYGNWCGRYGNGKPIDELDACCKRHDCCVHDALPNASSALNLLVPSLAGFACDRSLQACALFADCGWDFACNAFRAGLVILFTIPFNII